MKGRSPAIYSQSANLSNFYKEVKMKRFSSGFAVLAVLALGLASPAFAGSPGNNGGGNNPAPTTNQGGDAAAQAAALALAVQQQVQLQLQAQLQTQKQIQELNAKTGDIALTFEGDRSQRPVFSAIAPAQNSTANCAIGVSGGVTAATWSISGGSAYESDTCVTIEQAKVADARGEREVGGEIMCGLAKYRAARKSTGRPCLADREQTKTSADGVQKPWMTDPLARKRDGLPPL